MVSIFEKMGDFPQKPMQVYSSNLNEMIHYYWRSFSINFFIKNGRFVIIINFQEKWEIFQESSRFSGKIGDFS
jgi:hypothetical protein